MLEATPGQVSPNATVSRILRLIPFQLTTIRLLDFLLMSFEMGENLSVGCAVTSVYVKLCRGVIINWPLMVRQELADQGGIHVVEDGTGCPRALPEKEVES